MKVKIKILTITIFIIVVSLFGAETLFEIKDASDQTVFSISDDGLRVFNLGDTLMVISSTEIKAFIASSKDRALSRSFSVTTSTTGKGSGDVINIDSDGMRVYSDNDKLMDITGSNITAYIDSNSTKALSRSFSVTTSTTGKESVDVLEVSTGATKLREGDAGGHYTDFSPKNIFLGFNAGESVTIGNPFSYSGQYNLFIGNYAGQSLTSGYCNTYFGYMAGNASSIATHNSFFGYQAGMNNIAGSYNTAIGYQAGYEMTGGASNNMIGYKAGYLPSSGTDNVFIGSLTGYGNSSGDYNVALGYSSGSSLGDGNSNIFMGYESGLNTTDGDNNIFMGYQSGYTNSTGNNNQFMGYESGLNNTDGSYSLFLGYGSGRANTSGDENLFVGYQSGNANMTGEGNVMLGTYAGQVFTTGDNNVMIGRGSGCYASLASSNNVFIGANAGYGNGNNNGNVFIGYGVGSGSVGSNKLMIDNVDTASATTSLIYGDFSTDVLTVNGQLNVKTVEIADLTDNTLGVDGDIIQFSTSTIFDLGNNIAGEYWDDVVALDFVTYVAKGTKNNAKSIDSGLDKIMKLRPVTYRHGRKRFGLLPDEVEKVIPEAVVSEDIDIDPETGKKIVTVCDAKGMNYDQLIPVLIKSIQEQQIMINEKQEYIEKLEFRLERIEKLLDK